MCDPTFRGWNPFNPMFVGMPFYTLYAFFFYALWCFGQMLGFVGKMISVSVWIWMLLVQVRTGGWYLCILGLIQFLWENINHAYWVSRMPWTCYPHRNEVIWPYKILQAGHTCHKASRWFIRWKSGPSTWRWPDLNKCWLTFPCLMVWQWTPRV